MNLLCTMFQAYERLVSVGAAMRRWTCDLHVVGSIPAGPLSRNIGQLSRASLRGR